MLMWTVVSVVLLALSLVGVRVYLARTHHRLNVLLRKLDSLKPAVDDALAIFREEKVLISHERLTAGFALEEARWEGNEAFRWITESREGANANCKPRVSRFKGDLYAWLIMRESQDRYLIALKYAQPQDLDQRALKRLSKLSEREKFHSTQATEMIERLHRKQRMN